MNYFEYIYLPPLYLENNNFTVNLFSTFNFFFIVYETYGDEFMRYIYKSFVLICLFEKGFSKNYFKKILINYTPH